MQTVIMTEIILAQKITEISLKIVSICKPSDRGLHGVYYSRSHNHESYHGTSLYITVLYVHLYLSYLTWAIVLGLNLCQMASW